MMPAVSTVRCERETLRGVLAGQWCVIHFGQHAALFRDDAGHLLVVSDPVRGLVPDGVQIAPADLRALLDAVSERVPDPRLGRDARLLRNMG